MKTQSLRPDFQKIAILAAELLLLLPAFLFCVRAAAAEDPPGRTVRVGYYIMDGYQEIDENGRRSGYGYDYLQRLAVETGWKFEYVDGTWKDCLDLLAQGEIDLVGAAQKTPERESQFGFPRYETGICYAEILVRNGFQPPGGSLSGLRVGLLRASTRNQDFFRYCQQNGYVTNVTYFDTMGELSEALESGAVDAIATDFYQINREERVLVRFSAAPFYFITQKDDHELLTELNEGLSEIKLSEPYYDAWLYAKYYEKNTALSFTEKEQAYIASSAPIRIACHENWNPVEYRDPEAGGAHGIGIRLLEVAARNSGLAFEYLPNSFPEAVRMAASGEADCVSGFTGDGSDAGRLGLSLSEPYLNLPILMMGERDAEQKENSIAAIPDTLYGGDAFVGRLFPDMRAVTCNSVDDCFRMVRRGEVDFLIASSLEINTQDAGGLKMFALPQSYAPVRLGHGTEADPVLCSVLDKAVQTITAQELSAAIIAENHDVQSPTPKDFFVSYGRVVLLAAAVLAAALCTAVLLINRRAAERLRKIAYTDTLTGLPNWDYLEHILPKLFADAKKVFVNFDIDKFKFVNDFFGYSRGDALLKSVAQTLQASVKQGEIAGRISRDNFVLVLLDTGDEALTQRMHTVFQRIQSEIPEPERSSFRMTFSCGIYRPASPDEPVNRMNDQASLARASVKNRQDTTHVVFYVNEMREQLVKEKEIEDNMRPALLKREFHVYLQAKVEISSGKILGAEALVRWIHPVAGLIPPSEFIPVFEKDGFITELDFYVLRAVCKQLQSWILAGKEPIPVSVNLSRVHLMDPECVNRLVEIVREYGVPHSVIEFELTESVAYNNGDKLVQFMWKLKEAGFSLSMDDFGTGYSSLSLLKNIPIDVLKVDKGFLDECLDTERGKTILADIVSLARHIRIDVVTEGVETREQADFLLEIGCAVAQGYYYAKPMPMKDFDRMAFEECKGYIRRPSGGNENNGGNGFLGGAGAEPAGVGTRFPEISGRICEAEG